jgi:hypothetical protein
MCSEIPYRKLYSKKKSVPQGHTLFHTSQGCPETAYMKLCEEQCPKGTHTLGTIWVLY